LAAGRIGRPAHLVNRFQQQTFWRDLKGSRDHIILPS